MYATDFFTAALFHVEINEVNHLMPAGQQAIKKISRHASENKTERELAEEMEWKPPEVVKTVTKVGGAPSVTLRPKKTKIKLKRKVTA